MIGIILVLYYHQKYNWNTYRYLPLLTNCPSFWESFAFKRSEHVGANLLNGPTIDYDHVPCKSKHPNSWSAVLWVVSGSQVCLTDFPTAMNSCHTRPHWDRRHRRWSLWPPTTSLGRWTSTNRTQRHVISWSLRGANMTHDTWRNEGVITKRYQDYQVVAEVKTRPALEKWVDPVPGLQVKRIAWSWTWLSNPGRHRMAQKRDFGTITYCIRPENNVSNSSEISWFDMYLIYVYIYIYDIKICIYIWYYIMYIYIYILYIICIIQNVWERILLCLIGMISWWFNHDSTRSNKKIAWRQLVGRQGQQDFTGSIGRYLRAVGSTGKTTGPIKIPHGPWALWLPKNVLLPCNSPALPNHGIWMYFGFFQ